jgi:hypothetical protein
MCRIADPLHAYRDVYMFRATLLIAIATTALATFSYQSFAEETASEPADSGMRSPNVWTQSNVNFQNKHHQQAISNGQTLFRDWLKNWSNSLKNESISTNSFHLKPILPKHSPHLQPLVSPRWSSCA